MYNIDPPYKVKRTIHTCSFCGAEFVWTDGSQWYGNYKVHGRGASAWETEQILAKACSEPCVEAMKRVYKDESTQHS